MHAFEKNMATHSSILAWRIPGTEEHGGLLSVGHTESDTTKATNSSSSREKKEGMVMYTGFILQ